MCHKERQRGTKLATACLRCLVVVAQGSANLLLATTGEGPRLLSGPASTPLLQDAMERLAVCGAGGGDNELCEMLEKVADEIDSAAEVVLVSTRLPDLMGKRRLAELWNSAPRRALLRRIRIVVDGDGEAAPTATTREAAAPKVATAPAAAGIVGQGAAHLRGGGGGGAVVADSPQHRVGPVPAAPAVRRWAREQGVDLRQVHGTGPGGRIVREDVERFMIAGPTGAGGSAVHTAAPVARPAAAHDSRRAARHRPLPRGDRKSTRLNSSHTDISRMPSSA